MRSVYVQLSDCEVPHLHHILRYREETFFSFLKILLCFPFFIQTLEKKNREKNCADVRKTVSREKKSIVVPQIVTDTSSS